MPLPPLQIRFGIHEASLQEVRANGLADLRQFAIKDTVGAPRGPAFADVRRHDALNRAMTARLIGAWSLDNGEAVSAVQWLIAKVIAAVDDNEPPILSA